MQAEIGFEASAMALSTRLHGWSADEVKILAARTLKDARDRNIHPVFHLYVDLVCAISLGACELTSLQLGCLWSQARVSVSLNMNQIQNVILSSADTYALSISVRLSLSFFSFPFIYSKWQWPSMTYIYDGNSAWCMLVCQSWLQSSVDCVLLLSFWLAKI